MNPDHSENPSRKIGVGISLSPVIDGCLVFWTSLLAKSWVPQTPKDRPTRGDTVTAMVDALWEAGWNPGDKIRVIKTKGRK